MERARALPPADLAALPYGDDPWRLVADAPAIALPQTPPVFALGNGFIGLRGPGSAEPAMYLNGVYERVPIAYHEAAHGYARVSDTRLPVSDVAALHIDVDGVPLAQWDRIELDLRTALLRLQAVHAGVRITAERIVTMEDQVVATRVHVKAKREALVTVRPALAAPPVTTPDDGGQYDPRVGPTLAASPWREVSVAAEGRLDRLVASDWAVAAAVGGGETVAVAAGEGRVVTMVGALAVARGDDDTATLSAARDRVVAAERAGFDALLAAQERWFAEFWDAAEVTLPDHPRAEQALRHALFQLVQAAGRDGRSSIAAKGQTGEGYEGHVFWDAESYVLPALVHVAPATARAMLAWRIAGLAAARDNARAMGQMRGALYPWRTIGGHECSSFFPAGAAQYHINADIAHALRLYVAATGDRTILDEGGAEMLAETARIWLAIGFHDPARDDAFVINRVTGPDEYSAIVDNNLYTNLLAAEHLRFAVEAASDWIDPAEAAAMRRAADAMLLPHDAARDIPAQDDRFFALEPWPFAATPAERYPLLIHHHPLTIYRHRVAKQADAILAAAIMPNAFDRATRARMLDAYEAVTVHDSTLSASAFAVAAAGIGDAGRAVEYWRVTALTDLADLFGNSGHGLHMAALAGAWNALAYGFAGMQVIGGLRFAPIAVPALGRYGFTIVHRDARLRVTVDAATVRYELIAGSSLSLRHGDEPLELTAEAPCEERPLA